MFWAQRPLAWTEQVLIKYIISPYFYSCYNNARFRQVRIQNSHILFTKTLIIIQCVAFFPFFSSGGAHIVITSHVLVKRTRTPAFVQTMKGLSVRKMESLTSSSKFCILIYVLFQSCWCWFIRNYFKVTLKYQSNIKPVFPPDVSSPNGESKAEVWKEEEVTGRVCLHKHN